MGKKQCALGFMEELTTTIGILGLGFVGLTTALGFSEKGYCVLGYDANETRQQLINNGKVPFYEPGLDDALNKNLNKTFYLETSAEIVARKSDIIFFCVGTPCGEDGKADLSYIFSALDSVFPVFGDNKYRLLIIKSTIPPGTAKNNIFPYLREKGISDKCSLANNPEFLREGKCWDDFIKPDRIVCGVQDERAAEVLKKIYVPFNAPIYFVSLNTAEFIKYLSNALLASMISFSNEMSMIAEVVGGINVRQAFHALHEDKRLKKTGIAHYIFPGCGYGGYCLPKDIKALAAIAKQNGLTPRIINEVIAVNEKMPSFFTEKILSLTKREKSIGILGLSFKPSSDDVRDSASAKIICLLLENGIKNIYAYDPVANHDFNALYKFNNVEYLESKEELCKMSDVIVLVTAWEEFKFLRFSFPQKEWIDCRYFLEEETH